MSGIEITCGACGHRAGFAEFDGTPLGGPLPDDTFQCPACGHAWRRAPAGGWRTICGVRHPGRIEIRPAQPRL